MKKKYIIIGVIILVLASIGTGSYFLVKRFIKNSTQLEEEARRKQKITEPVNVIPVKERPFARIIPDVDGIHLTVEVYPVKKPANRMEYLMEYMAGSQLEGLSNIMSLDSGVSATEIMMGTCSAGGSCTHHKDREGGVKSGKILMRFLSSDENYALENEWNYIQNSAENTNFLSKDAFFQLTTEDLSDSRFAIVFSSPGYPGELPGKLQSAIYTLGTSSQIPEDAQGQLKLRADSEGDYNIAVYQNEEWTVIPSESDGKNFTAEVPIALAYAVVEVGDTNDTNTTSQDNNATTSTDSLEKATESLD